jgi:uncharacterized protein YggU (UPF0235/DUF167 family)
LASPLTPAEGGALLTVHLTPKASRARLGKAEADAAGRLRLKAWVTKPPADGAANRALVELLADALDVPKCDIEIRRGLTDRTKTLFIEGDAGDLARRLEKVLG